MDYVSSILRKLNRILSKDDARTVRAKKNILASFLLKGGNILIGFYLVPLSLGYLDLTTYGIWLTLYSIISWFSFFDIGLGNGLRNKFAVAKAKDNYHLARTYISTTYAILGIIVLGLFFIFVSLYPFVPWATVLNAPMQMEQQLGQLAFFVFTFFCIRFVLKLITTLLTADQKPAGNTLINFISQLLVLVVILILTKTTSGNILYLGVAITASPIIVLSIVSIVLYRTKYAEFRPSLKFVDFKYSKDLMGLGFQFFIIQIAAIILFTTDNMIITQVLGPAEVTSYNIAHKYFHIVIMVFMIILSPFWSAVTEAYSINDYEWIKRIIGKLIRIWLLFTFGAVIMLLVSKPFYKFWVGEEVLVPFSLSAAMAIFVIAQAFNSIFVHFINGVGKLRLQIYTGIFAILFNIPLSILFAKNFQMGSTGVILATLVSTSLSIVLRYIQYQKIINNTAEGIWNK